MSSSNDGGILIEKINFENKNIESDLLLKISSDSQKFQLLR